ncbi:terminase ATPase subunit family protein [Chitinimonas sp. PSY-7]|uniref:terminase large subunit domain-containing protein n=1 Tax=Chitinimonas sp. PSY-7 TaxID=3459088 RepID=UPI00403FDA3B
MTQNATILPIEIDPRRFARALYWQGWRIKQIATHLNEKVTTVHSWKRRDEWDNTDPIDRVESSVECRLQQLVAKEVKSGADYKEIDLLGRQLERAARVRKYSNGGNETDLNPKIANRNNGPRKPPQRNAFSETQQAELIRQFTESMFDYQYEWFRAGKTQKVRNILKSRQIGATYYFAHEALVDALTTGRNQIFLSASKAQAHVFKNYITKFAKTVDVELRGETIMLSNGAQLHFLGTNAATAQSYTGNLYVDEYFWIPRFKLLQEVASGIASHKHWRETYFSTPSSKAHEAYPFWSGKEFNVGRPSGEHIELDITHKALAGGRYCEDGQWRQIVTVMDAVARGCHLFDIEQLKSRRSPAAFQQLFMCEFIDDGESVFPLSMLENCMVDSYEVWHDFKPFALRPFGHRAVWIGYDPAYTGDSAGLVVIAPPLVPGGKFRVLDTRQLKGRDFAEQAAAIKSLTEIYNVTYIGIDTTGIGQGVFQLVNQFFPMARAFNYSVDVKNRLVMKAQDVIRHGRLEFDSGKNDLTAAFMAIRKTITPSGRYTTYEASRSADASHADLAWACMHALANEPLEGMSEANTGFMELC